MKLSEVIGLNKQIKRKHDSYFQHPDKRNFTKEDILATDWEYHAENTVSTFEVLRTRDGWNSAGKVSYQIDHIEFPKKKLFTVSSGDFEVLDMVDDGNGISIKFKNGTIWFYDYTQVEALLVGLLEIELREAQRTKSQVEFISSYSNEPILSIPHLEKK